MRPTPITAVHTDPPEDGSNDDLRSARESHPV
ncbi:MAG: hypothetical protein QOI74_1626, partial [Micromonosporaceae bacterium]|nr:hypothetical protein [Micromonosporaceae bacterium]